MTVSKLEIFSGTSGPHNADIMIVGEAWGFSEAKYNKPFVGASGKEFTRMLRQAGIDRDKCFITNVVSARPPDNDLTNFFLPTKEGKLVTGVYKGLYPSDTVIDGINKLKEQIKIVKPKVIIAAGNYALWALTSDCYTISNKKGYKVPAGIMSWRGSQLYYEDEPIPVLPIIHPAMILRQWSNRPCTLHDLTSKIPKALKGNWDEPQRTATINPSYSEVIHYLNEQINVCNWGADTEQENCLAVDIETLYKQFITCIGIGDACNAICIPFFYFNAMGDVIHCYTKDEEYNIVCKIKELFEHPNFAAIGQNFLYDLQYIANLWNVRPKVKADTMLMHHVLYPGTPKGLHYLSSLYCDYHRYWKDESQEWNVKQSHEDMWMYNCKDIFATYECYETLTQLIARDNMQEQFQLQMDQLNLAFEMMQRGVKIDKKYKSDARFELMTVIGKIEEWLIDIMPEDLRYAMTGKKTPWYNSPKQQVNIFYEELDIKPVLHKKTGNPTCDADALPVIAKRMPLLKPVVKNIEKLRSAGVFTNTFLTAPLDSDDRMRCSFNVGGTETFRWSSSKNAFGGGTNLQNIPKGKKFGEDDDDE